MKRYLFFFDDNVRQSDELSDHDLECANNKDLIIVDTQKGLWFDYMLEDGTIYWCDIP